VSNRPAAGHDDADLAQMFRGIDGHALPTFCSPGTTCG
jgi:hypothetical protein